MRKYRIESVVFSGLLFLSCNLFAQSPGGILNQSFWLQGNFSPERYHSGTLNFNPAMVLSGKRTSVKLPGTLESLPLVTIFTVYQNTAVDENPVWEMKGNFGDLQLSTRQVSSKSRKTNIVFAKNLSGSADKQIPQATIHTYMSYKRASAGTDNNGEAYIRFGSTNSSNASDLVAEFILYEKILDDEEITKVETYLALKYGITLEKNYLSGAGETIWNRQKDKDYSNNIAGIGRDERSALYQKQGTSSSMAGHLVIGVNKIVQFNSSNTGLINDQDYLIWGDNAQSLTFNGTSTAGIMLPGKRWLMKSSGASAARVPTELKVDTKTLLPGQFQKTNLFLVIDRSGAGDFAPANCQYISPDNISADGIATFNPVYWNTKGSGKDIFTFGFKPGIQGSALNSNSSGISFQLYPNPVSDGHYKIGVTLDKPRDIEIRVYDLNQHLLDLKKGTGRSSYLVLGYIKAAPGSYLVRLTAPGTELYQVLILQ